MRDEWRIACLGDLCEMRAGSVFPPALQGRSFGQYPFIKVSDMNLPENAVYIQRANNWVDEIDLFQLNAQPLPAGTTVFAKIGEALKANRLRFLVRPTLIDNNMMGATPIAPELDPRFFFYALSQFDFAEVAGGTALPYLTTGTLSQLELLVPPFNEQRAIAHILGTLDDKIELNRRMSETLEAMARAIFKSWFVDFEPVRAKMEGRWRRGESLPGLPAHLYDLFPSRLVDSELGEIPEGWEVSTLDDILAELVSGARPKGGAIDVGVPSIGAENVIGLGRYDFSKEKFIPREFFQELKAKGADVRPLDVLLYKDGAQIGRKTIFDRGFPHHECTINEHVFILRCINSYMQRYLFFWLDLPWITGEIIALNSNSAQPGINQAGVRQLPFLRPTHEVVIAFDRLAGPLTDALFERCLESRTLAALRDCLLPKLISGEIRTANWKQNMEEI